MNMKKGLHIVVNYNTWNFVDKLIDNLAIHLESEIELLIIDSNSIIDCPIELNNKIDNNLNIKLILLNNNYGYFNSVTSIFNTIAINNYDYFIVSNTDVEIITSNFYSIIRKNIKKNLIIAPSIVNLDGIQQNPHRQSKPNLFVKIYWNLFYFNYHFSRFIFIFHKVYSSVKKISKKEIISDNFPDTIYSPHGSFIIFSVDFFVNLFSNPLPFFLYAEEDYIGSLAKKLNYKIKIIKELKIKHFENVSTGMILSKNKYQIQKKAFMNAIRPNW
jgi:hypothetical protein